MITYQIESIEKVYQEDMKPLAESQWEELRYEPLHVLDLDFNLDAAISMERMGSVLLITARDDTKLIGYLLLLCTDMLNHKGHYHAMENAMYVDHAYRGHQVASTLLRYAEHECKTHGVEYLSFAVTPSLDYSRMLVRGGFLETERVYTKRL